MCGRIDKTARVQWELAWEHRFVLIFWFFFIKEIEDS
jgi:hypothetical protein